MDPLSLAASVFAVIQISSKVIKLCYNYQGVARGASEDANRIASNVSSLQGVLHHLLKLATEEEQNGSSRLPALKELTEPDGQLTKCMTQLDVLLKGLEQGSRLKALGKALKLPFKEKEVKVILDNIEVLKGTLNLALSADHTASTLVIREDVARVRQRVDTSYMDHQRKDIRQWLAAPDSSSRHDRMRRLHQKDTGDWFIRSEVYQKWKGNGSSFLWVHAIPGCGKSVLWSVNCNDAWESSFLRSFAAPLR